jgi:hypothetical protein
LVVCAATTMSAPVSRAPWGPNLTSTTSAATALEPATPATPSVLRKDQLMSR